MTLQNDAAALVTQADGIISPNKPLIFHCVSLIDIESCAAIVVDSLILLNDNHR